MLPDIPDTRRDEIVFVVKFRRRHQRPDDRLAHGTRGVWGSRKKRRYFVAAAGRTGAGGSFSSNCACVAAAVT